MHYLLSIIYLIVIVVILGCNESTQKEKITPPDTNKTTPLVTYESNNSLFNTRNITPLVLDFSSTYSQNNKAAYVTSQCYTKTVDENLSVHNPCYSCHTSSKEPNYVNDWELQESAAFSEYTKTNRFTNLFKDRTELVSQVSDEEILEYVREDNYIQKGQILLANRLQNLPQEWDYNNNGVWNSYMPDCYFNFDSEGFDKTPENRFSGWRAFGYYPFLGTFWPTNGSTDDVLIRLDHQFMLDENGKFDIEVYKLNLSIVEALIKQKSIDIDTIDENLYGVDLNQDGVFNQASQVVFKWDKPRYDTTTGKITDFSMSYVGLAKQLLRINDYLIAPGLYPKNTEFLHSVRYIDIDEDSQSIKMASRMKELRYAKKIYWVPYSQLSNATLADIKEKDDFPDRLRTIVGNTEYGASNNLGWVYQGFIEDARGELRPQNYEETQYCIGCHSGIGAIADSTFVFQRKLDKSHFQKGWYHWMQDSNGLKNIKEPLRKDGKQEYAFYLSQNGAGDEFRANDEVKKKFFDVNGSLKYDEALKIKNDISYLLYPSLSRVLKLNKAYKIIVEEQSYIYGRDAHIKPIESVYKEAIIDKSTQIKAIN